MNAENDGHSADCWCHYLPHLIAVRPDQKPSAIEATGGHRLENGEACQILDGLSHDVVADVLDVVGLIKVDAADPHDLVAELNAQEIEASPVHGVGYLGHGGFQGSEWTDAAGTRIPSPGEAKEDVIAVVDSGIAPDDDLPDWMKGSNVICDRPIDTDTLPHSHPVGHGTFVTSLIRRVSPGTKVSMVSARPDPGHLETNDPNHQPAPPPTDELNVLGAVLRLLKRHRENGDAVKALNLSLGVHACPGDDSQRFIAIRRACDLWIERYGDQAPIFAAAGNSPCPQPLYPAAFNRQSEYEPFIFGVAAAREAGKGDGEPIVWDGGTEVRAPDRAWVTDAAPGRGIPGLSGQDPDHVGTWGGSSHATAIVSAGHVIGLPSVPDNDIRWWPDRAVSRGNVPNLVP